MTNSARYTDVRRTNSITVSALIAVNENENAKLSSPKKKRDAEKEITKVWSGSGYEQWML